MIREIYHDGSQTLSKQTYIPFPDCVTVFRAEEVKLWIALYHLLEVKLHVRDLKLIILKFLNSDLSNPGTVFRESFIKNANINWRGLEKAA